MELAILIKLHVPTNPSVRCTSKWYCGKCGKSYELLLDRNCRDYADWHDILPVDQQLLSTHVHTSTKESPNMCLFGRKSNGIDHLENPA